MPRMLDARCGHALPYAHACPLLAHDDHSHSRSTDRRPLSRAMRYDRSSPAADRCHPTSTDSSGFKAAAQAKKSMAPIRRVEGWRADLRLRWVFHRFRGGPQSGCHHLVSSPRHLERSGRVSRTTLTCLLRATGYGTYPTETTFRRSRRTRRPLNSPRVACSHCVLHRSQPKPRRFRALQPQNRQCGSAFALAYTFRLRSCKLTGVVVMPPLPPMLPEELQTAGPLRSTGITPLRRYYGPVRLPLAFGRFPGVPVIRPTLLRRFLAGTRRVGIEVRRAHDGRVRWPVQRFPVGPQSGSHGHDDSASPPTSRVEDWRADLRLRWWFQRFRGGPQSGCHRHVSSPRHVERSRRISRTPLSCVLRVKGYETYHAGSTFDVRLRTR